MIDMRMISIGSGAPFPAAARAEPVLTCGLSTHATRQEEMECGLDEVRSQRGIVLGCPAPRFAKPRRPDAGLEPQEKDPDALSVDAVV
jgi:hypothetical protein